MKIIHENTKKGIVKITIENTEDLWHLSTIINTGDHVKASTTRKITVGTEEKSASYKKVVTLRICVEETTFSPEQETLRIAGTIIEGPEDIPRGSYHTITLTLNDTLTIEKERWQAYQINKLKEATTTKTPTILICVFDREEAYFANMTRNGYKQLAHLKGDVTKKIKEHKATGDFYKQIIQKLQEYDQRFKIDKIILASPSFWKEELLKTLGQDTIRNKLILATCSSVDETSFNEVIKRDETQEALRQDRIAQEIKLTDTALTEIAKNGLVTYGIPTVNDAAQAGAVRHLLITDKLIKQAREQKKYDSIDNILKKVDAMKGTVTIIHSDHSGGKKIDGIGGIIAFLRYKI